MHDCPECESACYCDGDDTPLPSPVDCIHVTDGCDEPLADDELDFDEGGEG